VNKAIQIDDLHLDIISNNLLYVSLWKTQ